MTLGAFFDWGGVPVLFADVAITSPNATLDAWEANYLREASSLFRAHGKPLARAVRKVVDVCPNVIYCWSGRVVEAPVFHHEITTRFCRDVVAGVQDVVAFVESYPACDATSLQIIILVASADSYTPIFLNTISFPHDKGPNCALIGTGTDIFYQYLGNFDLNGTFSLPVLAQMYASLYNHHLLWGYGQSDGWGLAFEVRALEGGVFRTLGDFHTSTWKIEGTDVRRTLDCTHFYNGDQAIYFINGTAFSVLPFGFDHQANQTQNREIDVRHGVIAFQKSKRGITWMSNVLAPPSILVGLETKSDGSIFATLGVEQMDIAYQAYRKSGHFGI